MDPLFQKLSTVLNFKVLTSPVERSMSGVQRRQFNVQGSGSSVQSPASSLQSPESSVESPAFRVQRSESNFQLLRPESRNSGMPFLFAIVCQVLNNVSSEYKNAVRLVFVHYDKHVLHRKTQIDIFRIFYSTPCHANDKLKKMVGVVFLSNSLLH